MTNLNNKFLLFRVEHSESKEEARIGLTDDIAVEKRTGL